jgi:hypothetical protein
MMKKYIYYFIYLSVFRFSSGLGVTITTASTPFRLFLNGRFSVLRPPCEKFTTCTCCDAYIRYSSLIKGVLRIFLFPILSKMLRATIKAHSSFAIYFKEKIKRIPKNIVIPNKSLAPMSSQGLVSEKLRSCTPYSLYKSAVFWYISLSILQYI